MGILAQGMLSTLPEAQPGGLERSLSGELPSLPGQTMEPFGIQDRASVRAVPTLMKVLHYSGLPQLIGMSAEFTQRADSAARTAILTMRGAYAPEDFKKNWKDSLDGKLRISNREFYDKFLSREFMAALDEVKVLPGWAKVIFNPDPHLAGQKRGHTTLADVFSGTASLWATPFAALAFTPVRALQPLSKLPIWSPFRTLGRGVDRLFTDTSMFGQGNVLAAAIQYVREPLSALERHPHIFRGFVDARDRLYKRLAEVQEPLHKSLFHREALGGLIRKRKLTLEGERNVTKWLFGLKDVTLSGAEELVANDLWSIIGPTMGRLQGMNYLPKTWKATDRLKDVFPTLIGRGHIPQDVLQSWDWRTLGHLPLPLGRQKAMLAGGKGFQWTDENLDLATSVRDFMYAAERKLIWNERVKVPKTYFRKAARQQTAMQAIENVQPKPVQYVRYSWENRGPLLTYKPRKTLTGKQLPGLEGTTAAERSTVRQMINEISGRARGRTTLELGQVSRNFFNFITGTPQAARITRYFEQKSPSAARAGAAAFPEFSKTQRLSMWMTHNVVRSVLWGNLGAAVKNTSQLLNTATVHGLPETFKGMYMMSNREWRETALKEVGHEFKRILTDDHWVATLGQRFDKVFMAPFNAFENGARGTTFNVGMAQYMKRSGARSFQELKDKGVWDQAVRHAVHESLDTNFVYGILGHPSSLRGPVLRPATTLLSYPGKQAEFYRRAVMRDGSALLRAVGMHGWAIDTMYKHAGVNTDSWLGWGFVPPVRDMADGMPFMQSPQVRFVGETAMGLAALGAGKQRDAQEHFRSARGQAGQLLSRIGAPGFVQHMVSGALYTGLLPFPIVAVAKTQRMAEGLLTGKQVSSTNDTWVPVSKDDALKSVFFQTRIDHARQELRQMGIEARETLDKTLDRRAKAYVKAANGQDGQALMDAARELAQPVVFSAGVRRPDMTVFNPYPEMIEERLRKRFINSSTNKDLIAMMDAGWLMDVYWAHYISVAMEGMR